MAPIARHRLGFRSIDKERLLFIANRSLIVGLVLAAVSIALAVSQRRGCSRPRGPRRSRANHNAMQPANVVPLVREAC